MSINFKFRPKLVECLQSYTPDQLNKDLAAGITVGVLALPLAMAFAIASGVPPSAGIWTSIVAGLLIALFGGSRVQIGGPTGAFIPIIYGIVTVYGYGNLLGATLLSGVLLLVMGITHMGQLIRYIPVAVVIGFTNGIAVVIFMAQIKDFFGLDIANLPAEFFARCQTLAASVHSIDVPTLLLASVSLIFLVTYNHLSVRYRHLRRVPGPLAVLIFGTLLTWLFSLPVDTIGSRFGGIPQEMPTIGLPEMSISNFGQMISPAITIALLGAIESLLSARVADNQIDDRHDPNQELVGQGIANIVAPFFGGFAATGAIARTTTNVRAGGRTPVAGVVHALVLMAVVFVAAPLAYHVPLATLSAIVMVVAVNMGQWREFVRLRRFPLPYRIILLSVFLVTVVFDLTVAVELGMAMACLFFIYRISRLTRIEALPLDFAQLPPAFRAKDGAPRVAAWALYGSLFFGAMGKLEDLIDTHLPEVLILDLGRLVQIDTSGLEGLVNLNRRLATHHSTLILCNMHEQPRAFLRRSGFVAQVGAANVMGDLDSALKRAQLILQH